MTSDIIVLVVDDEEDIREIISFGIKSLLNCKIYQASNGEEAIQILHRNTVSLVICDYNMPEKNGGDVYREVLKSLHPCMFVLCSSVTPEEHSEFKDRSSFLCSITKPKIIAGLSNSIEKFKKEVLPTLEQKVHTYTPINIGLLHKIRTMPGDVFIKITDHKFIRVFTKGSTFDELDYAKFVQKSVLYLYTFNLSSDVFKQEIGKKILEIKETSSSHPIDIQIQIHDILSSTFKFYGFNESFLGPLKEQMDETITILRKNKSSAMLLARILKDPGSYISKHSFMLAMFTMTFATKLEWSSELTHAKLGISSLMHDVFLDENIENETALLMNKKYDHNFATHSERAVELLAQIPQIPAHTATIISEHHEIGQGLGLPSGIDIAKVSPLSSLFSFCHFLTDFAIKLYAQDNLNDKELRKLMLEVSVMSERYEIYYKLLEEIDFFDK